VSAFRNLGGFRFEDVHERWGFTRTNLFQTAVLADLDDDGDLDLVILNSREAPTLLRNLDRERGGTNHWCQIRLRGRRTNRDGVGAKVVLHAGDRALVDEVHAGRGYQGHFGTRLHFGLGAESVIDRIEVRWIGGGTETFDTVPIDRLTVLTEGSGRPVPPEGWSEGE
jgi:hypothetical protein